MTGPLPLPLPLRRPLPIRRPLKILLILLALACGACGTQIGDSCTNDFSCGAANICDLTAPEGYCTRTPCRNRGCEDDEAVCVQFHNGESYCMHECSGKDDCRDGYSCLDAGAAGSCGGTANACLARGDAPSSYCYWD